MKKKIIIISFVIVFIIFVSIIGVYLYIDYRDSKISLINESIEIEYGEIYNPNVNDLIDINKFDFINLDKISIKNEMKINDEKGYAEVGEYFIHVYYKDLDLVQKVIVKDSISSEINVSEKIELPYNTDLTNDNFSEYIKITDLSETKEYNIDFSNINKEIPGEYTAIIEVEDIYNNKAQKEFKIIIQEKIEEKVEKEIPSKKDINITSNQNNSPNNKTTQNNSNFQKNNNQENINKENTNTSQSDTQLEQSDLAYWCVEGGSHHIAGDGANEHGYYKTWEDAHKAFENYTKGWASVQYKISQCGCGLFYFWAIQ